jgi:hypothetical protein
MRDTESRVYFAILDNLEHRLYPYGSRIRLLFLFQSVRQYSTVLSRY